MKTLELLKDYANSSDNVWLQKQLESLELDIEIHIKKETLKNLSQTINRKYS